MRSRSLSPGSDGALRKTRYTEGRLTCISDGLFKQSSCEGTRHTGLTGYPHEWDWLGTAKSLPPALAWVMLSPCLSSGLWTQSLEHKTMLSTALLSNPLEALTDQSPTPLPIGIRPGVSLFVPCKVFMASLLSTREISAANNAQIHKDSAIQSVF